MGLCLYMIIVYVALTSGITPLLLVLISMKCFLVFFLLKLNQFFPFFQDRIGWKYFSFNLRCLNKNIKSKTTILFKLQWGSALKHLNKGNIWIYALAIQVPSNSTLFRSWLGYSNHLNTRLVRYSNGQKLSGCEWSGIQMASEYWTKKSGIWNHHKTYDLNNGPFKDQIVWTIQILR